MSAEHWLNLMIHVGAGLVALWVGAVQIARAKGTVGHRRRGRVFVYAGLVVCASAALGLALFRFMPLFAVLTVQVGYQLASGWRAALTREKGPAAVDAMLTLAAAGLAGWLAPVALGMGVSRPLVYGAVGAVSMVLAYDALRWMFPRRWFAVLWRYEHSYKLIASLFGMVSALAGNAIRFGQPWAQILPLAVGLAVIAGFFVKLWREDAALRRS